MTQLKAHVKKPVVSPEKRIRSARFKMAVGLGMVLIQFLFSGCVAGNKSADLVLVPVSDSATGVHYPGKFVWNDLLTDDVDF